MSTNTLETKRKASENPYYILATIYGTHANGVDHDTHEKNRYLWNAWACQGLTDTEKDALLKAKPDLTIPDWTEALEKTAQDAFNKRLPNVAIPEPSKGIDFSNTHFEETVYFGNGFIFTKATYFGSAIFTKVAYFGGATFTKESSFGGGHLQGEGLFR